MAWSLFTVFLASGISLVSPGVHQIYIFKNVKMSWAEAQSYCRVRHTDLASVDDFDDQSRLIHVVNPAYNGPAWIGLKRVPVKRWVWSSGEDTLSNFKAWGSGEPNSKHDCVVFSYGVWSALNCSSKFYFVCYNGSIDYFPMSVWANWTEAQSYCRQYYTDLASVRSSDEMNLIKTKVLPASWVWIGLFQDSWQWSDERYKYYRYWIPGQPSVVPDSRNCVSISRLVSWNWFQESCDTEHPFICYGSLKALTRVYQFVDAHMTWSEAQSFCRERFTDLATADSGSNVEMMVNTVAPGCLGAVWIGLHTGKVRWACSIGLSTLSFNNWGSGEPNGDGQCVRSFNGHWYDENCNTVLPFACFNDSSGFVLIDSAMSWRDAQSYCRLYHTDLFCITSEEQQNLINSTSSIWIGLFRDSWEWSDKWSIAFRNWKPDQPLLSGSNGCVGLSTTDSGKWSQYNCDLQQPFICYGDPKFYTKQTVRMKLSCDNCSTKNPSSSLNVIEEKLRRLGVQDYTKVRWGIVDGEAFHQEYKHPINDGECKT
ncbi:hypothetical protein DNTS_026576 [Danionella cerebrum]|uniref:C-type lectin domain-containing protein n=1 Tax=Danionella cerebrum TaxID=2873325 RepID=A0A553RK11_9TELE|nr:hypothetical protein DNTS_026576 [Danionella translucida]